MITLERPAYYSNDRYAEYNGLSTDDKATIKAYNADKFYEIDTGKTYRYNEVGNEWIEQPTSGSSTGGGGDFKADGTVPMTGNLYMNGNNIMGVKSISNTDSGMAIESELDMNNHKVTGLLDPVADQDAATKKYVDDHSVLGSDGKVDSDLNMNEHGIVNAHRISTDGPAPLYIGATIEAAGTTAPRLTGATDGSAAFVKADTQNTYIPVSVGSPTAGNHAVTKEYSDGKTNALQASAILKSGGKMTGKLKITAAPTEADDVVDKEYVDAIIPAYTTADDGKVLGVVEGKLAWVAKA